MNAVASSPLRYGPSGGVQGLGYVFIAAMKSRQF